MNNKTPGIFSVLSGVETGKFRLRKSPTSNKGNSFYLNQNSVAMVQVRDLLCKRLLRQRSLNIYCL